MSDLLLFCIALFGLVSVIGGLLYLVGYGRKQAPPNDAAEAELEHRAEDRDNDDGGRALGGRGREAARRRLGRGGRGGPAGERAPIIAAAAPGNGAAGLNEDLGQEGGGAAKRVPMTKKEMAKAAKKQERKEAREYEEAQRAERREREENAFQARKAAEAQLDAKEKAKEDAERAAAAVRAAAAAAEYDEWKGLFETAEAGNGEALEAAESQEKLAQFITHIQRRKVVVLEELATDFGISAQEVVNRVTALEATGRLSGVMDDRGKFIFVSEEEMAKVASFIKRRGRVSVGDLVAESNRLIDLRPKDVAVGTEGTRGEERAAQPPA